MLVSNVLYTNNLSNYNQSFTSRVPNIPVEKVAELVQKGMHDSEIGEIFGVSRSVIGRIRRGLGLQAVPAKPVLKFSDDQLRNLYEQGYNDVQIGEMLGVSSNAVFDRRKKLGLQPKSKSIIPDHKIIRLNKRGYNDAEIGRKLGFTPRVINKHRRILGLESPGKKEKIDFSKFDFYYLRTLIDEGNSLSQLAEFYKVGMSTIRSVLSHFGLKTQEATLASAVKKEELQKLLDSGKTQREIADAFFLEDEQTVTHIIKKFGLYTPIHKVDKLLSIDKIADLIFEGYTPHEIAKRFNVDVTSIKNKMKQYGFDEVYKSLYQPHDIPASEIINLLKRGYSVSDIAEMNHVSLYQMVSYISKNKILKLDISRKELMESVEAGMTIEEIAKSHNVAKNRVPKILSEHGLKTRGQLLQTPLSMEIVEKYAPECKTYVELAQKLGVSPTTAKGLVERYGLSIDREILVFPDTIQVKMLIKNNKYISVDEIAKTLGVKPEAVERVIRKFNVKMTPAHKVSDYYSLEFAKWVSNLMKHGDSPVQIAEMIGLSSRRTKNILENLSAEYSGVKFINFSEIPANKKSPDKADISRAISHISKPKYARNDDIYGYSDIHGAKEHIKYSLSKKNNISVTMVEYLLAKYDLSELLNTASLKLLS